jgi:hypothetical protein
MSRMIITVTAVLALITGAATALEVTLNPSEDAGILANHPDNNYGGFSYAWIGYNNGWCESLVYFDLYDYMGIIVEEATLELYLYSPWGTIPDKNYLNPVDGAWEEHVVTWNTSPGFNFNHSLYFPAPMMGWLCLDVTAFVEDWVEGTYYNYGFYLRQLDATYGGFYFNTKEGGHQPELTITYQQSDVEATSFGRIKALFK